MRRVFVLGAVLLFAAMVVPQATFAGGAGGSSTGMPWEDTLDVIVASVTGPVATAIGILLIVGGGIALAFSEGQAMKRVLWVFIGLGVALNAARVMTGLFPSASGEVVTMVEQVVMLV